MPHTVWGALCPSNKSGLMNKQIVKTYRVWFGLVWWALFWSLELQPRAQKRARLAEDAPARNAFWTVRNIPSIRDSTPGPHVRLNAGWSLADDIAVLRPGCPLEDGDPPDPVVDDHMVCFRR